MKNRPAGRVKMLRGANQARMAVSSQNLRQVHADRVLTPWSQQKLGDPPMMVRAHGVYLEDADGKEYLDFSSGLIAVNLGHGNPRVVKAIQEQAERLCYAPPSFGNDARAKLAAELSAISPWPEGARTFFTTSGADAWGVGHLCGWRCPRVDFYWG